MQKQTEEAQENQLDVLLFERDDLGHTPLHVSLLYFQLEAVRLLLEHGSCAKMAVEGSSPLHIAVSAGAFSAHRNFAVEAARLLLQNGGSILHRDDWFSNPLHVAARLGLVDVLQVLLNFGLLKPSDYGKPSQDGMVGTSGDDSERGERIAALVAALYAVDRSGETPFHAAASADQPDTLKLLLSAAEEIQKALPDGQLVEDVEPAVFKDGRLTPPAAYTNKRGWTPLHSAAHAGSTPCVLILSASVGGKEALAYKDRRNCTVEDVARRNGYNLLASTIQKQSLGVFHFTGRLAEADMLKEEQLLDARHNMATASNQTLILHHEACLKHFTCDPANLRRGCDHPPENVGRLKVLLDDDYGVLKADEFCKPESMHCAGMPRYRWESNPPQVHMADILRVHSWPYIQRIQQTIDAAAAKELLLGGAAEGVQSPPVLMHIDADTAVSAGTWDAACYAAGSVIKATQEVIAGQARNAFAAVRPPGHHAGPDGLVADLEEEDLVSNGGKHGSLGFCLINNIAIGAAYALHVHRSTIQRVAILDFDVHHGNGTEAVLQRVVPTKKVQSYSTPFSEGTQTFSLWCPWLDEGDKDRIFFASVQGYGHYGEQKVGTGLDEADVPQQGPLFYPGTGKTRDSRVMSAGINAGVATRYKSEAVGPRVINVGINGPGGMRGLWRRAWRDKILPELVSFNPDIIFVSAGFDAHKKDEMNSGFIGLVEADYDWVTREIVKVANYCCNGRVVSVLEGGYKIGGRFISAFARSVATHVRALGNSSNAAWDPMDSEYEREMERKKKRHGSKVSKTVCIDIPDLNGDGETVEKDKEAVERNSADLPEAVKDQFSQAIFSQGASAEKRRRTTVDYVSLNKRLEEELQDCEHVRRASP